MQSYIILSQNTIHNTLFDKTIFKVIAYCYNNRHLSLQTVTKYQKYKSNSNYTKNLIIFVPDLFHI